MGGRGISKVFRAGGALVDITPKAGTHLSGSGAGEHRPAQSVLDPLYARAAAFELNGTRLCLLGLDLCIITEQFTDAVRTAASARFGLGPEAVMLHAVQTHSAPSCGPFMLDPDFPLAVTPDTEYLFGSESGYTTIVVERSLDAIGQALSALEPVSAGIGRAVRDDLAFNRRAVMRDGRVTMPWLYSRSEKPFGPVDIAYMEGPVDPEVAVFCMRTDDMRMPLMLLHHTCHPVNVFGTRSSYYAVSSDWPGSWAAGMQEHCGSECTPLVLNGCCGNINPWPAFVREFVPDHRRMGRALTETARGVLASMRFAEVDTLDVRTETVPLSFRDVPSERLAAVRQILADSPEPKWHDDGGRRRIDTTWFRAASTASLDCCRQRTPEFPYEVQAFRIGDVAVVGLPGEPFVEGQLEIKVRSPAEITIVAHGTSHYVGYVPTADAYLRGGHEANTDCTYWAKLASGSLTMVVDTAVALLEDLFS